MSNISPVADPTPGKKSQPLPWTHQETLNLIQAYQEKWYSLQRSKLKAWQWQEVVVTVAVRCGHLDDSPAKTALQCRHKMEKLRRRYRSERQGLASGAQWPYYDAMEALEHEPLPISARPLASLVPTRGLNFYSENGHEAGNNYYSNYVERIRGEEDGDNDVAVVAMEEENKEMALAVEIRRFDEKLMWVERKRMEMMRETERLRMEMENTRIEMILDANKKFVDVISASFGSNKSFDIVHIPVTLENIKL
ncbi:hypothetical protein GOBAR_AA34099 [Gossypium barbadense]|uniref:Myb/SANT-like DNA-binding domain-containing protein n=1 Tax=Gossypium barbadense TaxID=3634 RepID=A0A2P5W695_GOSBA|nr:hypothetical protein GOBAR_AA34099 [Gossypium barbadense]